MIEQIYLSLILVGLTIGAVMAALWYKARHVSMLNLALIRLNEQHHFDTLAFLDHAWPLLARSSLRGMDWRLNWFGVDKQGQYGLDKGQLTERSVDVGDMSVTVRFYRHEGRGEQRYFEEGLMETVMLLLRTDMLIKAGTTDAALAHMARLDLFLQHDMKNIAQFIQLMGDQLAAVPSGKEHKVLDYLRLATPLIRQRADRIVRTLTVGAAPAEPCQAVPLRGLLEQLCGLYQLPCNIAGDAEVEIVGTSLEVVLDNIIKNYHDLALRDNLGSLQLDIAIGLHEDMVEVRIRAPGAPGVAELARLFEPFWSSTRDGLGIGLYQAQHLMKQQGGALFATQDAGGVLCFHVLCPRLACQELSF